MNAPSSPTQLDEMANQEAEQAVLGALMLQPGLFDSVSDILQPSHFMGDTHAEIYAALQRLATTGKFIDPVALHEELGNKVELRYLAAMSSIAVASPRAVIRHANIIVSRFRSRQLASVVSQAWELAHDHSLPIDERLQQVSAALAQLQSEAPRDEWVGVYQAMTEHTQVIEDRSSGKREAMSTGLCDLDEYLEGGLRPGELVIVGARPSMGKTALGLTIGVHMALQYRVGLLSMEMSHGEVNDRLTAMLGSVSLSAVKRPNKGAGLQWDRVLEGVDRAKTLNLHTCDQGGLNINQVRTKARNLKRLHGLDVLIVDYIGLMSGLDPKANRNTQLEEVSRGLKGLAKELGICVLCLAQLNRKTEERPDQMPMMSDLRDSGAIEQDADVIVFIKRPIMANPELGPEWNYYAKLSVAKNRQGRCGYLNLNYIGDQTKFSGWAGEPPRKQTVSTRGASL